MSGSHPKTVADLRDPSLGWHSRGVLPPWVIQEIAEERQRREEDDRARGVRIEPPMPIDDDAEVALPRTGGVVIIDISPRDDSVIDL